MNDLPRGLSFDPNTHHTGVCWTEGEKVIRTEVIAASGLYPMMCKIANYIFENNHIEWVACEDAYLGKNVRTYGDLKSLVNEVGRTAYFIDVPFYVGSASEINLACNFPAKMIHTRRKDANMDLAMRLGYPEVTQDEADAIACSLFGWSRYKESEWYHAEE